MNIFLLQEANRDMLEDQGPEYHTTEHVYPQDHEEQETVRIC